MAPPPFVSKRLLWPAMAVAAMSVGPESFRRSTTSAGDLQPSLANQCVLKALGMSSLADQENMLDGTGKRLSVETVNSANEPPDVPYMWVGASRVVTGMSDHTTIFDRKSPYRILEADTEGADTTFRDVDLTKGINEPLIKDIKPNDPGFKVLKTAHEAMKACYSMGTVGEAVLPC